MTRGYEGFDPGLIQVSGGRRPLRRRAAAIGVVVAVALAGGLIGQLTERRDTLHPIPPGPFGLFPT